MATGVNDMGPLWSELHTTTADLQQARAERDDARERVVELTVQLNATRRQLRELRARN